MSDLKWDECNTVLMFSEWTDAPGGRCQEHGSFSGEEYREDILSPTLEQGTVGINLDGLYGMPVSFISEAFGGLAYTHGDVRDKIVFYSAEDPGLVRRIEKAMDEALEYTEDNMSEGKATTQGRKSKGSTAKSSKSQKKSEEKKEDSTKPEEVKEETSEAVASLTLSDALVQEEKLCAAWLHKAFLHVKEATSDLSFWNSPEVQALFASKESSDGKANGQEMYELAIRQENPGSPAFSISGGAAYSISHCLSEWSLLMPNQDEFPLDGRQRGSTYDSLSDLTRLNRIQYLSRKTTDIMNKLAVALVQYDEGVSAFAVSDEKYTVKRTRLENLRTQLQRKA